MSWLAFGYKGASGNIWKRARGAERDIRLEEKRWEECVQDRFGWVRGEGGAPRVAGGCKGKKVTERAQQRNDGVQQAIWEVCPISKLGHNLQVKEALCDKL